MTEGLVGFIQAGLLGLRQIITEALLIFLTELGIQLLIVEIPLSGIVNGLNQETDPSARAGVVGKDSLLITCGTEGTKAVFLFAENGVRATLFDRLRRDQSLQLLHVAALDGLNLLNVDQTILRTCNAVVLM